MRKNRRKMLSTVDSVRAAILYLMKKTNIYCGIRQETEKVLLSDGSIKQYINGETEPKFVSLP